MNLHNWTKAAGPRMIFLFIFLTHIIMPNEIPSVWKIVELVFSHLSLDSHSNESPLFVKIFNSAWIKFCFTSNDSLWDKFYDTISGCFFEISLSCQDPLGCLPLFFRYLFHFRNLQFGKSLHQCSFPETSCPKENQLLKKDSKIYYSDKPTRDFPVPNEKNRLFLIKDSFPIHH